MNQLYYIVNYGCDDATHGLVRVSDENFEWFKSFIENLNKNSTYACQPSIGVYKISEDMIKEIDENDDTVFKFEKLYFDGKVYVIVDDVNAKKEEII